MSTLDALIELQSVHDNLRVIARDLAAFPPELVSLDTARKQSTQRCEQLTKDIAETEQKIEGLQKELQLALRLEEHARVALKQTTQKAHYTAAIRELDERERHRVSIARPLKEAETKLATLKQTLEALHTERDQAQTQFDALHEIFLSGHENQLEGRERLQGRLQALEMLLEGAELARFNKLLQQRQGRVMVAVDNGNCAGCRTKIRVPLLAQIRDKGFLPCESCQRLLYFPSK